MSAHLVELLFFAGIAFFIIKNRHPPVAKHMELDTTRKILGYISFLILLLTFSPTPIGIIWG